MKLAYTMAPGRGDTDLLLAKLADDLCKRGVDCCGIVQTNSSQPGSHLCDMDVKVLPDGPILRISQNLGKDSRGCRLNPSALETAVGLVKARLNGGTDLLIINKFGKHEAEGRGFRDVIGEALGMDVPVLIGLNALNKPAFEDFAGDCATAVPPESDAIAAWIASVCSVDSKCR